MEKKFYKTIISVTVLSEEPYVLNNLKTVAHDIVDGDCAGSYDTTSTEVLNGKDMALELINNASDPEFFQLTETGEELIW